MRVITNQGNIAYWCRRSFHLAGWSILDYGDDRDHGRKDRSYFDPLVVHEFTKSSANGLQLFHVERRAQAVTYATRSATLRYIALSLYSRPKDEDHTQQLHNNAHG